MFSVTPVIESEAARGRRVSFSPDVDDSYRMNVIDKIKGLMDEVDTIHRKEERALAKSLEASKWAFKQKQEKELQDFLKNQKMEAQSFECVQTEARNNLRDRQQNETLRLFGTSSAGWNGGSAGPGSSSGGWTNSSGWDAGSGSNGAQPQQPSQQLPQQQQQQQQGYQRQTVMDYWNNQN